MKHPTLYKKSSKGKLLQWTVWTEDNVIVSEWGEVGGKLQMTRDEIKEGKNIGRSNETNPAQQAAAEAKSLWEKKLKKDYVKTAEDAEAGKSSELVAGGILPILAHRYDKYGDKIEFPAYAQPKLDGHRCIATVVNGKCTLWSRTRKPITSMPHIIKAIEETAARMFLKNIVLDGELYNHNYREEFEKITSLIRPQEPKPDHEKVEYHIYDTFTEDGYMKRLAYLNAFFLEVPKSSPLVAVETLPVEDEDELMLAFEQWLDKGYEGAIVRNMDGLYVNKRSYDLQKIKTFDDAEFEVIDVVEGRGKLAGHGIFICKTDKGGEFEAKMKGALADLKQYWEDKSLAVGRMMTVQFQGYTKKSKVPRFPVALRFREDV